MSRIKWLAVGVLALIMVTSVSAQAAQSYGERLAKAKQVLVTGMSTPGNSIPPFLLKRAKAIVIFPNIVKGGFIFGARLGQGVALSQDENHKWSAPCFYSIGGPSFGLQAGLQSSDIVLLVMNEKGLSALIKQKFTLGADMNVVLGPASLDAEGNTDVLLHADMITYAWSRGVFAGILANGSIVSCDKQSNSWYYGKNYTVDDILVRRLAPVQPDAADLVATLENLSK